MTSIERSEMLRARRQMEAHLILRAWEDEGFRKLLLSEPKRAIEQVFGQAVPEGIDIKVMQEDPSELYVVIPPVPAQELSQEDLAEITGGGSGSGAALFSFCCKGTHFDTAKIEL